MSKPHKPKQHGHDRNQHDGNQRLYFAYGSNLSLAQMASRCPTSVYRSLGILRGFTWIIGERGYANVVEAVEQGRGGSGALESQSSPKDLIDADGDGYADADVVYGMLYSLEKDDERALDRAEGVPYAYVKRELDVELITQPSGTPSGHPVTEKQVVRALVYVDEKRVGEGICKEEYVARMNRGIRDAMGKGMRPEYVERVLRRFVRPPLDEEGEGEDEDGDGAVSDPFHPKTGEALGREYVELSGEYGGSRDDA